MKAEESGRVKTEGRMNRTDHIKMLSLISTGIDSPVSSYLMMRKCKLSFLHFDRGQRDGVVEILEVLKNKFRNEMLLVIVDHDELMKRLRELNFPERHTCIYCKSSMFLFAERVCKKLGCTALVTGDSLGQVASQTLANIKAEESLLKIPVVRPLIGLDKEEIVYIAKKIGTYDISTRKKEACPYVPRYPATKGCKVTGEIRNIVKKLKYVILKI